MSKFLYDILEEKRINQIKCDTFKHTNFYLFSFDYKNFNIQNNQVIIITKAKFCNNYFNSSIRVINGNNITIDVDDISPIVTTIQCVSKNKEAFLSYIESSSNYFTIILEYDKPTVKSSYLFHHKLVQDIYINDENNWRPITCNRINLLLSHMLSHRAQGHYSRLIQDCHKLPPNLKKITVTNESVYSFFKNKHQYWSKQFISAIFLTKTFNYSPFYQASSLANLVLKNLHFLKNFQFSSTYNLENLYDEITKTILISKIESFIKKTVGNKYELLVDETNYSLLVELYKVSSDKIITQKLIKNKIAKYKDPQSFYVFLNNHVNILSNWTIESFEQKFKDLNLKYQVINNKIIARIENFNQIESIGSQSWCIVTSEDFFEQYTENSDQFLLFNFNLRSHELHSFIAFTKKNDVITYAHLKDDSKCDLDYIKEQITEFNFNKT